MNKHYSLLRFAILVLLGGLLLCAFAPGPPQAGSPLIFVADQAYAPITYLENGVPKGVYVDITQALGQAMNRRIEIRLMDWAVAQQQVLDGTADAISGMSISEQRRQLYDFSDVILTFEYSLFVRSDSPSLQSLNDYKGKKVGVTPGGYPRQVVEAIPEIQVVLVDTYEEGFQLLQEKKIEALAADKWVASYLIAQNHLEGFALIDPPFAIQESAFAVKKGNQALLDEINQGIRALQQQGEIDRIKSRWATTEVVFFTQREITQYLLLAGLVVMAVLLIGLLGWVGSLRKNIAQRRRVEAQLREAEAKYRTLIEKLPAITYLATLGEADQINQITYISPQIETLLGFPPEAWTQDPNFWPTRIHPADRERVLAASQIRDPAKMLRDLTYRALTREGQVLWFQSHTSFIFDDEGRPRYAQGILLDITDRRQAEEALHASEARYRAVVENQTEFIVRWKADGVRTFVNEAYCRHFGVTPEQALATSFLSQVAEDDRPAIEEKIARLNSGQVDMEIEIHRVINADGSIGWQEWIDQALRDEAGNLIEFQSVGRDVTARKQAEAALERYISRLEILNEIDRAILAVHSPEETALAALTRLRGLIPGVRAGVMLWDEQVKEMTLLAALATGPSAYSTSGMRFPIEEIPDVIEALRQGEPVLIEDVRALPRPFYIYNLLLEEGVHSWLHAPLIYQGVLMGALNFGAAESSAFHAEHIEIAREVANQLVIALQNAQLFALKQRSLSRMEILHEIDQAILTAQSPQATAQAALDKMRPLIGCLRASVSLFDFQANEEWLLAVSTPLPVRFPPNTRNPLEQFGPGIIDRLQHQQPFVIEDVLDWSGLSPAQQQLAADGIRSWLYTPLVYQGELIGSLNLGDTQTNPFGPERIEIAREVADQIAIAVQQARLFEQVTAARDQLQALSHRLVDAQEAERRHIARELHDEIGQALTGLKLALQMILRLSPETIPARVSDALKVVNDLMAQVHDLSLDLRPMMLDDLGLVSALLWLFEHYTDQTGVQVHSEFLRLENRLPPQVETTAYRIVQEALTNVARHSGAKAVWVRLLVEDSQLRLQVQDTGVGFNVPAALSAGERLGVAGMQERAALLGGWLQVDSQPGLGTQVTALLPFNHSEGA